MVEECARILYNENRVAGIFEIKNHFTEKSKIRIKKRKIVMLNWLKANLYLDFSFTKARTSTFLD